MGEDHLFPDPADPDDERMWIGVFGTLPFWDALRKKPWARGGLKGINAAVVGILAAALYDPIFTSSVHSPLDFAIAVGLFGLLAGWKTPSWVVVALGAGLGILVSRLI